MSTIYAVKRVSKNGYPLKSHPVKLFWSKEDAEEYITEESKKYKRNPYFTLSSMNAEKLFRILGGE